MKSSAPARGHGTEQDSGVGSRVLWVGPERPWRATARRAPDAACESLKHSPTD